MEWNDPTDSLMMFFFANFFPSKTRLDDGYGGVPEVVS